MNTYNKILLVSVLVILGLSIWAFMTRCNTDKFGDEEFKIVDTFDDVIDLLNDRFKDNKKVFKITFKLTKPGEDVPIKKFMKIEDLCCKDIKLGSQGKDTGQNCDIHKNNKKTNCCHVFEVKNNFKITNDGKNNLEDFYNGLSENIVIYPVLGQPGIETDCNIITLWGILNDKESWVGDCHCYCDVWCRTNLPLSFRKY